MKKYKIPEIESFNDDSLKLDWNEGEKNIYNFKNLSIDFNRVHLYPIKELDMQFFISQNLNHI